VQIPDPRKYARQFPRNAENPPESHRDKQLLSIGGIVVVIVALVLVSSYLYR
jgi:hypothetical protein